MTQNLDICSDAKRGKDVEFLQEKQPKNRFKIEYKMLNLISYFLNCNR